MQSYWNAILGSIILEVNTRGLKLLLFYLVNIFDQTVFKMKFIIVYML